MLTEMVEYGHKIEEKVKAMKSEKKENVQGTNSEGKETRTPKNSVDQKEELNIQPQQNEEIRIQKINQERLRNLWDNFQHSNIRIIGVPKGEEEEQEMENLFENISLGSSESPKEVGSKEEHTKAHHNYIVQD